MGKSSSNRLARNPAAEAVEAGWELVRTHPIFARIARRARFDRTGRVQIPPDGWAKISHDGTVYVHPTRLATGEQWAWVFAHLLLHLGFGHFDPAVSGSRSMTLNHQAAADIVVSRFLASLKFGSAVIPLTIWPLGGEPELAKRLRTTEYGVAGIAADMIPGLSKIDGAGEWAERFAAGLTDAVNSAVDAAGGSRSAIDGLAGRLQPWELARRWFITSYPLLGAAMSVLQVVADADLCRDMDIGIAAVSPSSGELYVNPHAMHSQGEWRFILAHEALHAALNHHIRAGGRDPYLFNIAADFVINGWLVDMGVGEAPDGLLFDPQFNGLSTEEVYDRIAIDMRRTRKLRTLRGRAGGDVLDRDAGRLPKAGTVDLDELLRRSLAMGLDLHVGQRRGLLPAGLVAEIRALSHPPIPWDVQLARWFEEMFPTLEPEHSYARPSRRQASTPDVPRAGWHHPEIPLMQRTFGVVLDTSGSMNARVLGYALGAIASYAEAQDVPAARVVFCDAVAYDAGYLDVAEIAGRVRVRGRGGTRLQPGIDLLLRAPDFPVAGPILVITDGYCDVLRIGREHAYLIPSGRTLPFTPKGPVFRMTEPHP